MKKEFADIEGNKIAFRHGGSGEPVLLVHGVASSSFIWDDIIDGLSEKYEVIAPDLLGCGDSSKPADTDYSIAIQAGIMSRLMEKLFPGKNFHLVGHDIGGGVAQIMAVKYPAQLRDLALVNPVGYDYWPVQPITTMRLPVIRRLTSSVMNSGMLKMVIRRALFHKERLTPELMAKFWQPMETMEGKQGFIQLIKSINNRLLTDITADLKKIEMPVLVIRGDADAYLSSEITARLAADIPGARLVHISHGGHFVQIDEPERITELLLEFYNL